MNFLRTKSPISCNYPEKTLRKPEDNIAFSALCVLCHYNNKLIPLEKQELQMNVLQRQGSCLQMPQAPGLSKSDCLAEIKLLLSYL